MYIARLRLFLPLFLFLENILKHCDGESTRQAAQQQREISPAERISCAAARKFTPEWAMPTAADRCPVVLPGTRRYREY